MLLKKLRSRNFFVEKRFGLLYTLTTMNTTPTGRSGRKNLTAPYALIQGSFWMSFCTAVSFASVYLLGLHYTNSQLGLILAAGNLLGALLGPELSAWVDRSDRVSALSLIPPVLTLQAVMLVILCREGDHHHRGVYPLYCLYPDGEFPQPQALFRCNLLRSLR